MSRIRIDIDDSDPRGAKAKGRVFLGSTQQVLVTGLPYSVDTVYVVPCDDTGMDLGDPTELESYGGGRTWYGDVQFSAELLEALGDNAQTTIYLSVRDQDDNVVGEAAVKLYNSGGGA